MNPLLLLALNAAASASERSPMAASRIPGGRFEMGCVAIDMRCEANERPRHFVELTRPYWLAVTETSIAEYRRFARATGYRTLAEREGRGRAWRHDIAEWDWVAGLNWEFPFAPGERGRDDWPAVQIAWEDADAYCRWAGGRLPTEAEWERAARGGRDGQVGVWGDAPRPMLGGSPAANGPDEATRRAFPTFSTFAGHDDGYAMVAPVGRFPANPYGLHDMAGNVYEWTADWIDDAPYPPRAAIDPRGRATGEIKAVRGGGWGYPPEQLRISYRAFADPTFRTATFGFRCAWDRAPDPISSSP